MCWYILEEHNGPRHVVDGELNAHMVYKKLRDRQKIFTGPRKADSDDLADRAIVAEAEARCRSHL